MAALTLYLDNCALQRPLDDRSQMRIWLEAEAVLSILQACKTGQVRLISSEVLAFEIEKNPIETRRRFALAALEPAVADVLIDDSLKARAQEFIQFGIKLLDAFHLASAERARADFFCTCDDRLLRRAQSIDGLRIKVVTPLELVEELNL